jgi:hypothetical protein
MVNWPELHWHYYPPSPLSRNTLFRTRDGPEEQDRQKCSSDGLPLYRSTALKKKGTIDLC